MIDHAITTLTIFILFIITTITTQKTQEDKEVSAKDLHVRFCVSSLSNSMYCMAELMLNYTWECKGITPFLYLDNTG
jgi:ascorbate-specific PTS system EIIC-type component UlaA